MSFNFVSRFESIQPTVKLLRDFIDLESLKKSTYSKDKIIDYLKNILNTSPFSSEYQINGNFIKPFKYSSVLGTSFVLIVTPNNDIAIVSTIKINDLTPTAFIISSSSSFEEFGNQLIFDIFTKKENTKFDIENINHYLKHTIKFNINSIQKQIANIITSNYNAPDYYEEDLTYEFQDFLRKKFLNIRSFGYSTDMIKSELIEESFNSKKFRRHFLALDKKGYERVYRFVDFLILEYNNNRRAQ